LVIMFFFFFLILRYAKEVSLEMTGECSYQPEKTSNENTTFQDMRCHDCSHSRIASS
jgi:hypothetical protein